MWLRVCVVARFSRDTVSDITHTRLWVIIKLLFRHLLVALWLR
jgi:hypothetical protein